jgi:hypothetical protein
MAQPSIPIYSQQPVAPAPEIPRSPIARQDMFPRAPSGANQMLVMPPATSRLATVFSLLHCRLRLGHAM